MPSDSVANGAGDAGQVDETGADVAIVVVVAVGASAAVVGAIDDDADVVVVAAGVVVVVADLDSVQQNLYGASSFGH